MQLISNFTSQFTLKEIADYTEMINEYLDKIRIRKLADFDNAIIDLKKILASTPPNFHEELRNDMEFVYDALYNPDMYLYIQPKEDYLQSKAKNDDPDPEENDDEYKRIVKSRSTKYRRIVKKRIANYQDIIKARINAKINEFLSLTENEKQLYIKNQQHMREQAAAAHILMEQGESHRQIREAEYEREQEEIIREQFEIEMIIQRERGLYPRGFFEESRHVTGFDEQESEENDYIARLVAHQYLTQEDADALTSQERQILNDETICNLIRGDLLSVSDAKALTLNEYYNLREDNIYALIILTHLSLSEAKDLTLSERRNLCNESIVAFLDREYLSLSEAKVLTSDELNNLSQVNVNRLIVEGHLTLLDAKRLNYDELVNLSEDKVFDLIVSNQLSVSSARELTQQQLEQVMAGEELSNIFRNQPGYL